MAKASDILPDNEWWDELDRQRTATAGGKEELCLESAEIMERGPMSAKKTKAAESTKSINEWLAQLGLKL